MQGAAAAAVAFSEATSPQPPRRPTSDPSNNNDMMAPPANTSASRTPLSMRQPPPEPSPKSAAALTLSAMCNLAPRVVGPFAPKTNQGMMWSPPPQTLPSSLGQQHPPTNSSTTMPAGQQDTSAFPSQQYCPPPNPAFPSSYAAWQNHPSHRPPGTTDYERSSPFAPPPLSYPASAGPTANGMPHQVLLNALSNHRKKVKLAHGNQPSPLLPNTGRFAPPLGSASSSSHAPSADAKQQSSPFGYLPSYGPPATGHRGGVYHNEAATFQQHPPPASDGSHRLQIFVEATRRFAPNQFAPVPPYTSLVTPTPNNRGKSTDSAYSRKNKSLGRLCETFVQKFQQEVETTQATPVICIDDVAQDMMVERRRIYDIINILDSVDIVRRKGKNSYDWIGAEHLDQVFGDLQQEGLREFAQDAVQHGLLDKVPSDNHGGVKPNLSKEKKNLGRLSQQFLQLFLVGHPVMSLTDASDKILGASSTDELIALGTAGSTTSNKRKRDPRTELQAAAMRGLKTKIRRLYDIANVFVSLEFITKLESDSRKAKPTFRWSYKLSPQEIKDLYEKGGDENEPPRKDDEEAAAKESETAALPTESTTAADDDDSTAAQQQQQQQQPCATPLPNPKLMANINATGARFFMSLDNESAAAQKDDDHDALSSPAEPQQEDRRVLAKIHQHGAAELARTVTISPTDAAAISREEAV